MFTFNTTRNMILARIPLILLCAFLWNACGDTPPAPTPEAEPSTSPSEAPPADPLIAPLEAAHQRARFLEREAIQFDLLLRFGGKERINATFTLATNSTQARIQLRDSSEIIVRGNQSYHSPEHPQPARVRFDAYTWSYFFLFPYKLSDPGTQWAVYPDSTLNERPYLARKVTFNPGTGDAPDDWYIAYARPDRSLIEVAAYIVTAGQSQEAAEKDPHAIEYLDYTEVDGVPIASRWKFWGWRSTEGLTQELGSAELSNIRFVDPADNFFNPPSNFVEVQ